jgi:hypothetical protein
MVTGTTKTIYGMYVSLNRARDLKNTDHELEHYMPAANVHYTVLTACCGVVDITSLLIRKESASLRR